MSAVLLETHPRLRLNPFAFPSDTTLRFILLFVFVVAADIRRWHGVAVVGFDLGRRLDECLGGTPLVGAALSDLAKMQGCYGLLLPYEMAAIGAGLLLLAAVTGAIYWYYPVWEVRRLRLTPLDPAEAPELFATLEELCNIAGLRRPPEFLWNPVSSGHLALAFGRPRVYRVGFTGALAVLHNESPASFRVVMLHELAHIRNGDVEKAYLALALWWGFLVAAMLPYLVVAASKQMDTADAVVLVVETSIVTGIVLLTRNAVLRARELYADARSLAWGRDEAAFTRVLSGLRPIQGLRRLLSPHPDPARRGRLLEDTDEMFRVGLWDAFGAGAAASLIAITFAFVAGIGFLQARLESAGLLFALVVVPIAIVVPLVAGAASIATWRTTFLVLMRGRSSSYVVQTAGSLAAGVVLCGPAFYGAIFLQAAMGGVGRQYVDQIAVAWSSLLMVALGLVALLIVVLAGALILFLKWVEAGATSWLSVAFHTPSPRAPCAIGILISCVLALAWFSVGPVVFGSAWFALHEEGKSSALSAMWYVLLASDIFPLNFIVWVSLIGFWAFPLGAGLWRPRARTHSGWPFLGTAPRTDPSLEPPLRLLRALLIGAAGGLAAGVALPWLRLPLPLGALHDVGYPETTGAAVLLSMTLTCMVIQGVIAALVVLAIPKLPIPHAMFAAFVAGCILTAGEVLRLPARGALMATILDKVIFGGTLVALAAALATWVLRLPAHALLARLPRKRAITE